MNRSQVTFDIEALPVQIRYIGEMVSPWDDDKRMGDAWQVTIGKAWRNKAGQWITTYYTGIGLRNKRTRRPERPTIAEVLRSLFIDATADEQSFSDWCDEYGYSDDSIKALNIYKACCDTARHLRQQFDVETYVKIQDFVMEM